ncbi:MAG: beta-galactosidase [Nitrosopumilus sp.]|nr:beta-galactosidase [Nitrosopumilus sp.]
MRPLPILAAALAAALAVALAVALPTPQDPAPRLGLAVNLPPGPATVAQVDAAYRDAAGAGAGRTNAYMFWSIVEPEPGSYDWRSYDPLLGAASRNGMDVTLFFSIVNGETLGPFPAWMGDPDIASLDPARAASVIGAALSRYPSIDSVLVSGQTESQFRRGGIAEYSEFFGSLYGMLKADHPDVLVGNSFALHHIINKDLGHLVSEAPPGDYVAFSYWPVDAVNEITTTPAEAAADLRRALELAPGPVSFFEVAWGTSPDVGGSEADQAEFVSELGSLYGEGAGRILHATWFRQHDAEPGTCGAALLDIGGRDVELTGSGLGGNAHVIERLDAFVCSSGLVRADGTPKPGWGAFSG